MKKQIPALVLILLLIVCLIVSTMEISALRQEIKDLGNRLSMEVITLRQDISNVAHTTSKAVSDALQEDSDPLRSIDWEWLTLDTAERTVTTRITALPKTYDAELTTASLTIGGRTVPMTLVDGEYVAEINLPLLEDTALTSVQLTDGSTVHTSLVDATLRPRSSFLPRISGQETSRQPLTDRSASMGQTATAQADGYTTNVTYSSELDITASAPFNSTLEVYVEAADSLGLTHRVWLWGYDISEAGDVTSIPDLPEYFGAIYVPDGTLFFQPDGLLYQSY